MRQFFLGLLCLLFTFNSDGQKKPETSDSKFLNDVLTNLQIDPSNPLKIDQQMLSTVANSIPEGPLKAKLLTYSTNLGADPNLSMRQVYWDLNNAFIQNSKNATFVKYAQTAQGLNLLINDADKLFASFKNGNVMPQLSMFVNDPVFVNNIQQLTGASAQTMQQLGAGITIATALVEDIKKRKAYKSDYTTYAQLSLQMVYAEIDKALSRSLIDAYVGRTSTNMLSPMYRYDFRNGSSLLVEKGILKYVDPQKGLNKSLISVENRNDGAYHKIKSYSVMPGFIISPDEKFVFINTGDMPDWNECDNCLGKQKGYLLDTETGSVSTLLPELKKGSRNSSDEKITVSQLKYASLNLSQLMNAKFQDGAIHNLDYYTPKNLWIAYQVSPTKLFQYSFSAKQDKSFNINGFKTAQKDLVFSPSRSIFWELHNDNILRLTWSIVHLENQRWTGSMMHINRDNSTYANTDVMTNELTGMIKSKDGKLFYTSATGKIGVLDLNKTIIDDPGFTRQMRASLADAGLSPYSFDYNESFLFDGVELKSMQWFNLPFLTFSPDEKYLIYNVRNDMFVLDPATLKVIKKFALTIVPYQIFFGKENGETTVYMQAYNEFKMPVIKKYSFDKLMTDNIPPFNKETGTNAHPQPAVKKGSVAEELKQLKALYDEGAITKDEYEKAKKKVLDN